MTIYIFLIFLSIVINFVFIFRDQMLLYMRLVWTWKV